MSKRSSGTPRVSALAVAFFYEHAAWGYDPKVETKEQGRQRGAERLAQAEQLGRELGFAFEWEQSQEDSSEWSDERPAWPQYDCICHGPDGKVLASLCCCDFGKDASGPFGPYRRVVEAELALEAIDRSHAAVEAVLGAPVPDRPAMPNKEQLQALYDWAKRHGARRWKAELDAAWLKAGIGVRGYTPALQQVRNDFGPSWLQRTTLRQIKQALEKLS